MGLQPFIEMLATELCTDYTLTGAWEEAYTYARQALMTGSNIFLFSTLLTFWHRTEALVRANDVERAIEDAHCFGERIGSSRRYRIPYLRALAVLAQHRGEIDVAIEYLQEAASLAQEIGLPGELWSIKAALGELHQKRGDVEQARRAFTQAATLLQQLADALDNDEQRANFLISPLVRHVIEQA